ncbi:hypothetical protein V2J09_006706, partial [Rumex salicifolius]
ASNNIRVDFEDCLSNVIGFSSTRSLGNYLGISILHKQTSKETFNAIIEKIQSRSTRWKSKIMSIAERLTLIKSVISTIPLYTMQSVVLLVNTSCEVATLRIKGRFILLDGRMLVSLRGLGNKKGD